MKVSNVSIIKGLPVNESIVAAITEMFNERASKAFIDTLTIDELVGICIQTADINLSNPPTRVSYFIATKLQGDFIRVEYCGD